MLLKWRDKILGQSRDTREHSPAERLYQLCLSHSRNPELYAEYGVSDTLDGRFDSLCLSLAVVLHRLAQCKSEHKTQAAEQSQQVFDIFCADMDLTLREMGVGDLGVAKRVKKMSEAFLGRLSAYRSALEMDDEPALADALRRNLFRQDDADTQMKDEKTEREIALLIKAIYAVSNDCAEQKDEAILSAQLKLQPFSAA